jgi:hypothetical protein
LFRTSWPNSIKVDTNYPSINGIQIYLNKGSGPLQRRDNHKNKKMGWGRSKILLLRTMKLKKTEFYMKAF